MEKLGLVLSGGGGRGAYQVGAMNALDEMGFHFDVICGTSVGALNGALLAQDELDYANQLWSNIEYEQVVDIDFKDKKNKLFHVMKEAALRFGLEPKPLYDALVVQLKEDKIRQSSTKFGLVVVKFPLLQPLELSVDEIPSGQLGDYLMASSACFPAFKPKKIDDKTYIDGGYHDNLPINLAIRLGANKIIAIDLFSFLPKKEIKDKSVKITFITSKKKLGSLLEFDKELAKANIIYGYQDTYKTFKKAYGEYYTFKGEKEDEVLKKEFEELVNDIIISKISLIPLSKRNPLFNKYFKNIDKLFLSISEESGKAFKISDLKIYDFNEYNLLLKENVNSFLTSKVINKPFINMNKQEKIIYAYEVIKDYLDNNKKTRVMHTLAYSFPKETMMGIYLYLINIKR